MKIPYRKPTTYMTVEQLDGVLKPHYGKRENGSYFIGFGIGPGWTDIVLDLHMKLVKEHPEYTIHQVKEKFATLRFYTGAMTSQGYDYITEAENLSAETCEECGRPGLFREDLSWRLTLCGYCHKVHKINKNLWFLQRRAYRYWFKSLFAANRWRRKRKESAKIRG
jgi:hypothetical protein